MLLRLVLRLDVILNTVDMLVSLKAVENSALRKLTLEIRTVIIYQRLFQMNMSFSNNNSTLEDPVSIWFCIPYIIHTDCMMIT